MGWTTDGIFFAAAGGHPFLRDAPPHDPDAARQALRALGYDPTRWAAEPGTLDEGFRPTGADFAVGAYPGGCVLTGFPEIADLALGRSGPDLARWHALFPGGSALALRLVSPVNGFAYALYEQGRLVRAHAGDAENGTVREVGVPLPEEAPFYESSEVRGDGRRVFSLHGDTFTVDQIGESLAFALAGHFLGCPLDEYPMEDLPMELFRTRARPKHATGSPAGFFARLRRALRNRVNPRG